MGSLPLKNLASKLLTFGIRVEPPTRTTSLTSAMDILASASTFLTGSIVLRNSFMFICSNLARVIVMLKSMSPTKLSTSTVACKWVHRHRPHQPGSPARMDTRPL